MLYGYLDESGTPGIAANDSDFLVVSLITIDEQGKAQVGTYFERVFDEIKAEEIHFAHNTDKTRAKIISLIKKIDFQFISVAIRKNQSRSHASYANIAKILSQEISQQSARIKIEMDTNPKLFEALKKSFKENACNVKIKQMRSKNNYGIQLADYIVGLSAQKLKGKDSRNYSKIADKCHSFIKK